MSDEIATTLRNLSDRLDSLERQLAPLLARTDQMVTTLEALSTLTSRVPILADGLATVANDYVLDATDRGVDLVERKLQVFALIEKASDPEALKLVARLLERTDLLATALDVGDKLVAATQHPEFQALLDRTTTERTALAVADKGTRALVEAGMDPVRPVGPLAALLAMRDPDVQRAVGFSLALAKRFGQLLA